MNDLEIMNVFKLFEDVEKSAQPELEKIPMLITYADKIYSSISIDEHEKIEANYWNDAEATWELRQLSPDSVVDQALKAYKVYEEKKALDNMTAAYKFYKNKYNKLMQVNRPFFTYTLDLLKKVNKHITMITKSGEMVDEMKSLRDLTKKQEQDITLLKEKNSRVESALDSVQERLEKQLLNASSYKEWLDLLSTRDFIRDELEVRILAHIMVHDETTRADIATKCNLSYPQVTQKVIALNRRGMITEKKRGQQTYISLNHDYLKRGTLEIKKKRDGFDFEMLKTSHKLEEKKEQEMLSDGDNENTTGKNSSIK